MVEFWFATNRNELAPDAAGLPTDFGKGFSEKGLVELRYGKAKVSGKKLDKVAVEVAAESMDASLDRALVGDLGEQSLGSDRICTDIRQRIKDEGRDLVVFIHGFNFSFREALQRTAELARFYGEDKFLWFLFSWPSNGEMIPFRSYWDDRADARTSGAALGRGLQKLAHFLRGCHPETYCGQKLHMIAHSMGNYALRHAVQAIRDSGARPMRRLFEEILLFAADEDEDAFEQENKLVPLTEMASRVTIYFHPGDRALIVSDTTKGNADRLGAGGPRNAKLLSDKVSAVNVKRAAADDDDIQKHQYYRINKAVRRDALAVLGGTDSDAVEGRVYLPEKNIFRLDA